MYIIIMILSDLAFTDPSGSPTGLSVVDSTADSCWLNWTAIPDEDINGESVGYEVHVVKNESAEQDLDSEPSITVLACGDTTEANVTMLDMFTAYSIKVAFLNNIGAGNYSDTVECITEEGGNVGFFCFSFIYFCIRA